MATGVRVTDGVSEGFVARASGGNQSLSRRRPVVVVPRRPVVVVPRRPVFAVAQRHVLLVSRRFGFVSRGSSRG